MRLAHDLYAETNPAFCALVVAEFVKAYLSLNARGPELPVVYLALPIALSGELAPTFSGTNKNTGLLEWLERSPQVQVGLAERVNASMAIVTGAVRFGCFTKIIELIPEGRLQLGDSKPKKQAFNELAASDAQSIKRGERLGYWFATAGSTRNAFDIMGLSL